MTDNVIPLPDLSVDFDLDAFTRPGDKPKPPFISRIGGRAISFADPEELDWRDVLLLDQPSQFLRVSLTPEDYEHILGQGFPLWKLNGLFERYYKHFDVEAKITEAKRRAALS